MGLIEELLNRPIVRLIKSVPGPFSAVVLPGLAAKVTWNTNEPATTVLKTSIGGSYGDTILKTSHIVLLENLSFNTTYQMKISGADASGNVSEEVPFLFTTPNVDTVAPSMSAVTATVTGSSVKLDWTTDEIAKTQILFDGVPFTDPSYTTAHSKTFTGLASQTTYTYRIVNIDQFANQRIKDGTATTLDITPPAAAAIAVEFLITPVP
jgi:chitodextrinase